MCIDKSILKGFAEWDAIFISSKNNFNINELKRKLFETITDTSLSAESAVVTNIRHYEALTHAHQALIQVYDGLQQRISGDLLAADIRRTLYHIGLITGEVTTDDLLESIFTRFCIGK